MNKIEREVRFALLLSEVRTEIRRSEEKFGDQDANPVKPVKPFENNFVSRLPEADDVKYRNDKCMREGPPIDHFHIILEEFLEATEELDLANVRKELIQLACVTVKAIRAIDYREDEQKAQGL